MFNDKNTTDWQEFICKYCLFTSIKKYVIHNTTSASKPTGFTSKTPEFKF